MAFFLTLIYICIAYLSPASLLPELAQYRIQLYIAILALLACIPTLLKSRAFSEPQLWLLCAFTLSASLSRMIAQRWIGGSILALETLVPNVIPLVLLGLTCTNLRRLRIFAISICGIGLYYVIFGARAIWAEDSRSLYVLMQGDLARIRGFSVVNDPNDFAQLLVALLPLVWLMWRHGFVGKLATAVITAAYCYGIYLTHSRGATIALAAILLFSLKDRMGTALSASLAAVLFAATTFLQFSGGRAISAESGADRMAAWGAGFQFLKSSPLFGIGFNLFTDNYEITAHNSFVLCVAELGVVGYYFWLAILVFAFVYLASVTRADSTALPATVPATVEDDPANPEPGEMDFEGVKRWARALRISLVGFLVAGFFLSRAYVLTLFLILGMSLAVTRMAQPHPSAPTKPVTKTILGRTFMIEALSIVLIYALLRLRSLL
jgi:hypothetical protein